MIHAAQLIAAAIKKTPPVCIGEGWKDKSGDKYPSLDHVPELPCSPETGICCLLGIETMCVSRKYAFSSNFTSLDLLKAPDSQHLSVDAFLALKYKWERSSSWFCDGETFYCLDRLGVREWVLREKMPKLWTGYATTSYKKHGALKSKISSGHKRIWLFENTLVYCTPYNRMMDWWGLLNDALRAGLGRSILESLDCPTFVMQKVGIEKWLTYEKWARIHYQTPLYQFLCYLLPSQEELKQEAGNV
jgi:hypothetical protein